MKTIVIATDFSENSKHAAHYAYKLACATKANITLFNAMIVPAEIPQAGLLAWPDTEYDDLMEDSKKELEKLKSHLQTRAAATGFEPAITCFNDAGIVSDVLNRFTDHNQTELTVIGAHGANGVNEFIIGNHARHLIDHSKKPLLMIPVQASYKPIKKIAYATDFKNIDDDLKTIYELIPFAKTLHAEILIVHIHPERTESKKLQDAVDKILVELSNKANYPNIYYRLIKNNHIEAGLEHVCENSQVDILAMAHRQHGFFDNIFKGSFTKRMADITNTPLLVFPAVS